MSDSRRYRTILDKTPILAYGILLIFIGLLLPAWGEKGASVGGESSPKCVYHFVVNELDSSKCPNLVDNSRLATKAATQNEDPAQRSTFFRGLDSVVKQVQTVETKLYQEIAENRQLKNLLMEQEQWKKKAQEVIDSQQQNMTELVNLVKTMNASLNRQRSLYKHIDNKLAGVMLDVVEVNNQLSQNPIRKGPPVEDKVISVKAASSVHECGISPNATKYKDCEDLYIRGFTTSGVYYITPIYTGCPVPVYCDMETPPKGWMVVQRRQDGSVSFNRNWLEYRKGFGDVTGEFWIGLDNLFLISNQLHYELRVDLWDFQGSRVYALYRHFTVDGERDLYRLHLSNHSGTAPDGFGNHDQVQFSTPDADNDSWEDYHCAEEWGAGWWYNNCWFVILNGPYYNHTDVKYRGISWNDWKTEQLKQVEMKIRPSGY